jgi:hypothetical protein
MKGGGLVTSRGWWRGCGGMGGMGIRGGMGERVFSVLFFIIHNS